MNCLCAELSGAEFSLGWIVRLNCRGVELSDVEFSGLNCRGTRWSTSLRTLHHSTGETCRRLDHNAIRLFFSEERRIWRIDCCRGIFKNHKLHNICRQIIDTYEKPLSVDMLNPESIDRRTAPDLPSTNVIPAQTDKYLQYRRELILLLSSRKDILRLKITN